MPPVAPATPQTELLEIDAAGIVTLRLVWPDRPFTQNWERRAHHAQTSKAVAVWREAFRLLAVGAPALLWCDIVVDHETATRRSVDVVACAPAVKAAIDGIVQAGIIPDDDPAHVHRVAFCPPVFTGRDALVLELTGPAA